MFSDECCLLLLQFRLRTNFKIEVSTALILLTYFNTFCKCVNSCVYFNLQEKDLIEKDKKKNGRLEFHLK